MDSTGQRGKDWRAVVQLVAQQYWRCDPFDGPLVVQFFFVMPRPKKHFTRTGGLRDAAPLFHTGPPDGSKLERAVEDALTGIIWRDDRQIVDRHMVKCYGRRSGVSVVVWPVTMREQSATELRIRLLDRLVARGGGVEDAQS